jgi:hypothetical protein
MVAALHALLPECKLNDWFMKIVSDGTGKTFENEHNRRGLEVTRPMLEAFFQARFFLEMAVRYGKEAESAEFVAERLGGVLVFIRAQVMRTSPA